MVDLYVPVVYVVTGIISYISSTAGDSLKTSQPDLIHHLDVVHGQLQALSRSIRSAHSDITTRQLEECQILGPMPDTICDTLMLDQHLRDGESLNAAIHSRLSPGSRSEADFTDLSQRKLLFDDLMQRRFVLEKLLKLVDEGQSTVRTERKRSCNLNLGFHCQTEQYSAIADMYNWLQSSMSPGRRRRRDTRGKRLYKRNW